MGLVPCGILVCVFDEFDEAETTVVVEPVGVSSLVFHEDCADAENSLENLGSGFQKWLVPVVEAGSIGTIAPEDT